MRILFVGKPESLHVARWIRQLRGTGWDLHLFPSTPNAPCAELGGVKVHDQWVCWRERSFSAHIDWPVRRRGFTRLRDAVERICSLGPTRAKRLSSLIDRLKPDLVHSLEFQHSAYLTLEAGKQVRRAFPPWMVQNWGNDIFLFQHMPGHQEKIREVLSTADFQDCETARDLALSRMFGYDGPDLPIRPNGGGFDLAVAQRLRSPGPTSLRRTVLVKGYQGWTGRALFALRAMEDIVPLLSDYRIRLFGCALDPNMRTAARRFEVRTGLKTEILPPLPHPEMLRMHGEARISIGLSISDAASISFLEALVMGSFPIQSDTAAADEWITHGKSGLIVPPEDTGVIAAAIRRALGDDSLVDEAARINWQTAQDRLDFDKVRRAVIGMYEECAAKGRG